MALYKLSNTSTIQSTGSFLSSAPVELTTIIGYQDFISKQRKLKHSISTVFDEYKNIGYVLKDNEIIATISGEAKDYLLEESIDYV